MVWYIVLSALGTLLLLSVVLPTPRRVWAFHLRAFKYIAVWLGDVTRLRRLSFLLRGAPYERMTRPRAIRLFCEDMGPTFIKFGQIVASSAGMFPDRYVEEFQACLDKVRAFSFEEVEEILRAELGEDRAAELVSIDPVPIASASIAQVHSAELRDGTQVVVKVQRPGIARLIQSDMRIMRVLAMIASRLNKMAELANPVGIIEDFSETLSEEIDFRKEAKNLDRFNEIMKELGYTDIRAPVPHWGHTTRRVLVMERFFGTRVDDVEEIERRGYDGEASLVKGLRAWFQCVLFYGFFHGDVHAGNLMLLEDGDTGFLDFGIVGRFDTRERRLVTDYLVAFTTGDFSRLAEVIGEMGGTPDDLDFDAFVADLAETYKPMLEMSFGELNYADFIPKINEVARRHSMRMPKEFVLITKQMLYFDRYAKLLAPKLNVFTDPRLIMSLISDIQKARAELSSV